MTGAVADTVGNISPTESAANRANISASIVINEIMWSQTGSSASQYVELRNLSSSSVNLNGWVLANAGGSGSNITLPNVSIAGGGYYLITKTAVSSVGNVLKDGTVTSNLVSSTLSLGPTSPALILRNASSVEIDRARIDFSPLVGESATPASMERKAFPGDGMDANNWYTGQARTRFDIASAQGTPGSANIYDVVLPSIVGYTANYSLFPHGNPSLRYTYSDTGGISASSATLSLERDSGTGTYVAVTGAVASSGITASGATYSLTGLQSGLYRATFAVSDLADNTAESSTVFLVDAFSMTVGTGSLSLGLLNSAGTTETAEVVVTIRTVGAPFSLSLSGASMSGPGGGLGSWNGSTGFGYDRSESGDGGTVSYTGSPTAIPNGAIASHGLNLDPHGNLRTYTYRVKYLAKPASLQSPGAYSANTAFSVAASY